MIEMSNPGHMTPNGFMAVGGTTTIFYIERSMKLTKIGPKIKKKHLEQFNACPKLLSKISNKEFKKWDLEGIVGYYNLHCDD